MNKSVVILSVYKGDTLEQLRMAIESLLNQTFSKFDLYIQEDGNVEIGISQYLDSLFNESFIKYHGKRSNNKGLAFSLNEMLKESLKKDYEYFLRMDADDICHKDRFKEQIRYMEDNKETDVVGSWIEEVNKETKERKVIRYPEKHIDIVNFFSKRSPIAHVSSCFRKTFFQKAGLYREDTINNEDLALWIDGVQAGCVFHNIQKTLVYVTTSNEFYARRGGIKKAYNDFILKIEASRKLKFGLVGYIYALGAFLLLISPKFIKKTIYNIMR